MMNELIRQLSGQFRKAPGIRALATASQPGTATSGTPVFSKNPVFTLLLPYFYPTSQPSPPVSASDSTLPPRSFLCGKNLGPAEPSTIAAKTRLFSKTTIFTPDSPRIYPASQAEVGQIGLHCYSRDHLKHDRQTTLFVVSWKGLRDGVTARSNRPARTAPVTD